MPAGVVSLLKLIDAPGSIGFFLVACALALLFLFVWPRRRWLGATWLLMLVVGYLILALPAVAAVITGRLPPVRPPGATNLNAIDMLVVFDGDNRRGRVSETLRADAHARSAEVWILGKDWILEALRDAGIATDRLRIDRTPTTTRDQLRMVHELRRRRPTADLAIVVSRLQAPRVAALVTAAGLPVTLLSSAVDDEPPTSGFRRFVPTYVALRVSRDAIYEHAALAYYHWRGWIGSE